MARPGPKPLRKRLCDLDPASVGLKAELWLKFQISSKTALLPKIKDRVAGLLVYARGGAVLSADVERAIDELADVGPPRDAIDIVFFAAYARRQIDDGKRITTQHLAALGSVDESAIRQAIGRGEIKTSDGKPKMISATEAKRWLKNREKSK